MNQELAMILQADDAAKLSTGIVADAASEGDIAAFYDEMQRSIGGVDNGHIAAPQSVMQDASFEPFKATIGCPSLTTESITSVMEPQLQQDTACTTSTVTNHANLLISQENQGIASENNNLTMNNVDMSDTWALSMLEANNDGNDNSMPPVDADEQNIQLWQCSKCTALFREQEDCENHFNTAHNFSCGLCNEPFEEKEDLEIHVIQHISEIPGHELQKVADRKSSSKDSATDSSDLAELMGTPGKDPLPNGNLEKHIDTKNVMNESTQTDIFDKVVDQEKQVNENLIGNFSSVVNSGRKGDSLNNSSFHPDESDEMKGAHDSDIDYHTTHSMGGMGDNDTELNTQCSSTISNGVSQSKLKSGTLENHLVVPSSSDKQTDKQQITGNGSVQEKQVEDSTILESSSGVHNQQNEDLSESQLGNASGLADDDSDMDTHSPIPSESSFDAVPAKVSKIKKSLSLICKICQKECFSKNSYLLHMKKSHSSNTKSFVCKQCGKSFRFKMSLNNHEKIQHNNAEIQELEDAAESYKKEISPEPKEYPCKYCNKKFKKKLYVLAHMSEMHSTNDFKNCQYCFKLFASSDSLDAHMLLHHIAERSTYNCDYCSSSFRTFKDLNRHLDTHLAELRNLRTK